MNQKIYGKLIRDRIPQIITQSGRQCEVAVMSDAEFETALREKLVEEAVEAKSAHQEHLLTELADVEEVIESLMREHGITHEMLLGERKRRRLDRGGFDQRLKLVWVE